MMRGTRARLRWLVTGVDTEPVELLLAAVGVWWAYLLTEATPEMVARSPLLGAMAGAAPLGVWAGAAVALGVGLLVAVLLPALVALRVVALLAHGALWSYTAAQLLGYPTATAYLILTAFAAWALVRVVWRAVPPRGGGRV